MSRLNRLIRAATLVVSALVLVFSSVNVSAADIQFRESNFAPFIGESNEKCLSLGSSCGSAFTIGTLNIWYSNSGANWEKRLEKSMRVIKEADVMGLQEVLANQRSGLKTGLEVGSGETSGYGMFPKEQGNDYAYSNPIVWKASRFEQVGEGQLLDSFRNNGRVKGHTQVKLKDITSQQEFYVINLHMENGDTEAIKNIRYNDSNLLLEHVKKLQAEGAPVFVTGDFNSGFRQLKAQGVKDGNPENLTYCILSKDGTMQNAYDARDNKNGCPTQTVSLDGGHDPSPVDHVYITPSSTTVDSIKRVVKGPGSNGSDAHDSVTASVKINGDCAGTETSGDSLGDYDEKIYRKYIFDFFKAKGLNDLQAAGIIGNMAIESGYDPQRIQGKAIGEGSKDPNDAGSSGWGLIQWTPGSKIIGLMKEAGLASKPIHSLDTQVQLVWAHMQNDPPITKGSFDVEFYKTITSVEEAVRYFEDQIEGAGKPNYPDRFTAARLALLELSGSSSTSDLSSTSTSTDSCGEESSETGAVNGNVVSTALSYAWPEYHAPVYTEMKGTYKTSVEQAVRNGKYVGGIRYTGVDCGGFITRVMQDSGVDPEYGGGGATSTQLAYLQGSDKYIELVNPTTADMKPGAIAIRDGHTYMYVGDQAGFGSKIASASLDQRSPMAGSEQVADPEYRWFILKS